MVQYNIWLNGNKKLRKKIKKQNINAKKDFFPESFVFSFCLKPPFELKWYFDVKDQPGQPITIESIELNPSIDDSEFNFPESTEEENN